MSDMKLAPLKNREHELARLEQAWKAAKRGRPQLVLLWGRRRVGKTFLLSHFLQGKRGVLFGATQQAEPIELGRLHEAVRRNLGDRVADLTGRYESWEAALRFFSVLAEKQVLAVALDEVPYLSRSTPAFASIVQNVWDHIPQGTKLVLILTGSAVSTVEGYMGAGAPLRGRPTVRLRLETLDVWSARAFLPRLEPHQLIQAYAACGGYPLHLLEWDESSNTDENLMRLAASSGGILLEDASSILREELPDAGGYARIFAAIGRGLTRYSEIADAAGQRIEHPLRVLTEAGFVKKSLPIGAPKGARPNYEVSDPYILFYFSVLYSDLALIEGGQGRAVMHRTKPRFETHIGRVFEEIAREHARRLVQAGQLPEDLVVGRWWAATGEPCEIDVLGLQGKRSTLLGEARWQRRPLGQKELEVLRRKVARVPRPVDEPTYVLWGRAGASDAVKSASVMVFDPSSMLRLSLAPRRG
jgi:AAA+ ATPase superfamily predicted ATPase